MELFKDFPIILDGATGTNLQKAGMPLTACTEQWVLENPQPLIDLQKAYKAAGSRAFCAPTFGCSRVNFQRHKLSLDVSDSVRRLVDISRGAIGHDCILMGDIGPTGLMLEPYGDVSFEECVDVFLEQASALAETDVDCILIETQVSYAEAKAAFTAARQACGDRKPIIVSFSCNKDGRTLWGDDLTECLEELQDMGASAFGVNCFDDLDALTNIMAELKEVAGIPLLAKPNAGLPRTVDGRFVYDMSPETMAAYVPRLLESGAGLIGGCCGTTPEHIAAIRSAIENA